MKEDIKDASFLFGVALLLWLTSVAITNPIMQWMLRWALKVGAVVCILGAAIAVINIFVQARKRKKRKQEENSNK